MEALALTRQSPPAAAAHAGSARPATDRHGLGAVYTPSVLASWAVSLLRQHSAGPIERVLDPACGDGALLAAAVGELPALRELVGVDVSEVAASVVRGTWPGSSTTLVADTLRLTGDDVGQVDGLIMNPPWGAELEISRGELRELGYELANGQYDSWDLFIEWSVRHLVVGTVAVAIVPDALFLPEHRATRRLLLDRTRLHLVARLGEGWFDGVFRGVAVIAYTVGDPSPSGEVRCIRLAHDARRRVLDGTTSFADEVAAIETLSSQSSWAADAEASFMSASSATSAVHVRAIESRGGLWTDWVVSGRGVEIGKLGRLVRCDLCQAHRQPPRDLDAPCSSCGAPPRWSWVDGTTLDRPEPREGWAPLIVGEDVSRYHVRPSRWLRLGLPGVQYKDPRTFEAPKLLVRKTGLGLNASVDASGSLTTQVVFHYVARPTAPPFILDYLEGLLCSRVLLAVHLSRSGETEWRSHPYVTPKVLATMPIPTPRPGTAEWRQAHAIAEAVSAVRSAPVERRSSAEYVVDRLVAGLFELDADGCLWVDSVLSRTQELRAFSHLRAVDAERLTAESAA